MSAQFPVQAVVDDRQIDALIVSLTKAGKAAGMTDKEIEDMNRELRKTGTEGVRNVNNVNNSLNNMANNTLKKLGGMVVAAFAIDRMVQFGKEVVKVTAEFQKFAAVLENTLGSRSAAQIALAQIKDFAARTPFSVQELTASFVKLVNQGFKPTKDQMRSLGDLAASQGKSFDQLTEAIIDAQTGEFERLKEFGVRASKEGDKVTFTFKGVKTQVDFTSASIREYILSLGDATGVTGGMAAISETLGGKISNLGDAWDAFMEKLGDGESGPLKNAVNNLTKLLGLATDFVETDEQRQKRLESEGQARVVENLKIRAELYGDIAKAGEDYIKMLEGQQRVEDEWRKTVSLANEEDEARINQYASETNIRRAQIQAIKDYVTAELARQKADDKGTKERIGLIKSTELELARLKKAKQDAFSEEEITFYNRQIEETERILKRLNKLGEDSFLKFDDKMLKEFGKSMREDVGDEAEDAFKRAERAMKKFHEVYEENQEKIAEATRHRQEMEAEGQRVLFDNAVSTSNQLFELRQSDVQRDIELLRLQLDEELANAGNNEAAKEDIRRKYAKKEMQLRARQAESERQQALFNLAITQGPAVARAFKDFPYPIALGIALLTALQFGIALTKTKAVPAPKVNAFAKGKYRLQGEGTETSDSIPAHLSKNESVITAKRSTGKYGNVVRSLVEGTDEDILRAMSMHLRGDLFNTPVATDSNRILDKLDRLTHVVGNKRETYIDIDENGFKKWVRQGAYETEYINTRYRS